MRLQLGGVVPGIPIEHDIPDPLEHNGPRDDLRFGTLFHSRHDVLPCYVAF